MKLMAGGLKAGRKVVQAQSNASSLSKAVTLGGHYRLFFPLCKTEEGDIDIVAATVPGRDLDYDALHMVFIPIDDVEVSSSNKVKDVSGLSDWKKIVNVVFDADYAYEVEKAKEEAKMLADRTGDPIDALALNQRLREIELTYYGDRDAKPQPIYAKKKPVMSGFKMVTATEAFLVPLKETGEPKWSAGQRVSIPISSKKAAQLQALLEKPEYCNPDANGMFLEVGYDYVGETKQKAGQAATFQGISNELSLKAKYPDLWKANASSSLETLAKDGDSVAAGNISMSASTKVEDVVAAIKKYISRKKLQMTYINTESDTTKQAARVLLENAVCANMPTVEAKLRAIVEQEDAKRGSDVDTSDDELDLTKDEFDDAKGAKSLKELSEAALNEESDIDLL